MATISQITKSMIAGIKDQEVDRRKGDYKCEIHYIGEIVSGTLFPPDEEIFCEASLEMSPDWEILSQFSSRFAIQTQCCVSQVIYRISHIFVNRTKKECMYGVILLIYI